MNRRNVVKGLFASLCAPVGSVVCMPTRSRPEDDTNTYAQRITKLEERIDALCTDIDSLVSIVHTQRERMDEMQSVIDWLVAGSNKHENGIEWLRLQEDGLTNANREHAAQIDYLLTRVTDLQAQCYQIGK